VTVKRTNKTRKDALTKPAVRMPEWVRHELSKAADANLRNLNAEINYRLIQCLKSEAAE